MASDGGGKVKMKRQHQGTPYARPKSLLKSVADRVTSIIPQSSWLTKWFSATPDNTGSGPSDLPSTSSSTNVANARPLSSSVRREDLNIERQRYQIPLPHVQMNQRNSILNDNNSSDQVDQDSVAGPSSRGLPALSTPGPFEANFTLSGPSGLQPSPNLFASTPAVPLSRPPLLKHVAKAQNTEVDDHSDSSESTSGCSSMFPHPERNQDSDLFQSRESLQNTTECDGPPAKQPRCSLQDGIPPGGRSLFSGDNSSLWISRTSECKRAPSFNVSSFGSPVWGTERSIIKNAVMSSPFYSGRTMYGGAANYRRHKNRTSLGPRKENIQVKPACNSASDTTGMSVTTKRILDMLDRLSTPVLDARRIPIDHVAHTSASSGIRRGLGPPTRPLTIPTVPELLKRRKVEADAIKPPVRTERKDLVASTSEGQLKSGKDVTSAKAGGKAPSSVRGRLKKQVPLNAFQEQSSETVELPNIPLPITSLPKFEHSSTFPSTREKRVLPSKSDSSVTFKFSSPLAVTEVKCETSSTKSFTFSQPLSNQKDLTSSSDKKPLVDKARDMAFRSERDSKRSSMNNVMFEHKVPASFVPKKRTSVDKTSPVVKSVSTSDLRTGSVMDVLGKKTEVNASDKKAFKSEEEARKAVNEGFGDMFKLPKDSWTCSCCYIPNKGELTKCASCETPKTPKPNFSSEPNKVTPSSQSKDSPYHSKPTTKLWVCGACPVPNKPDASFCVACREPKPKHPKEVDGFGDKFKPPSGSWECQTCSVKNETSAVKCISCETPKPGVGFGDKFKSQKLWRCSECWSDNNVNADKCAACGTLKAGTGSDVKSKPQSSTFQFSEPSTGFQIGAGLDKNDKQSGFKFGEPQGLNGDKGFSFGVVPVNSAAAPKQMGGFQFGSVQNKDSDKVIPSADKVIPSPGFTFGTSTKDSNLVKEVQPSSKANSSKTNATTGFTFGKESKSESNVDKGKEEVSKSESVGGFKFGLSGEVHNAVSKNTENKLAVNESSKTTLQDGETVSKSKMPAFSFTETSGESKANPFTNFVPPSSIFNVKTDEAKPQESGFGTFQPKGSLSQFSTKAVPDSTPLNTSIKTDASAPVSEKSLFQFGSGGSDSSVNQPQLKSFSFEGAATTDKQKVNAMSVAKSFSFVPEKVPPSSGFGAPSTGGFNFNPVDFKTESSFNSGSGTVFGAPSLPVANKKLSSSSPFVFGGGPPATTTSTNFSFGAPKDAEPSTGGTFSFTGSNAQGQSALPQSNFSFGTPTIVPGGFPSAAPAVPNNFNFGSTQSTPVFNFGSSQNAGATFTFGQASQAPSNAGSSQGFNFNPVIPSSLNFTGGEAPQFSSNPAPYVPPSGPSQPKRIIKRAMRRNLPR